MPSKVSRVYMLAADGRTWCCQGDVVRQGEGKKKSPDHHFSSSPASGGEMEMDTCQVYEEPVAVKSLTKTCHTSGSASPMTSMKTGRCVFVRGDATPVPSQCVRRITRYLRIGVIHHGSMAWLDWCIAERPGGFSQDKVRRQSYWASWTTGSVKVSQWWVNHGI